METSRYHGLPNRPTQQADVIILPIPHELTVSYREGTRGGPAAILEASEQLEYYDEDGEWSPLKHMGVAVLPAVEKHLYELDAEFHQRLARCTGALPTGALVLALGGEHSITPSLVAGRMLEPGTVVVLDAHGDLRSRYEGSEYSHACPVHRLRALGHRVILVGIRSLFDAEAARIAEDPQIDCYSARSLRRSSAREALCTVLAGLRGPLWLSVDMDVFDPGQVPGVGTPQPGGLDWYAVIELIEALLLNTKVEVRGCDVVELIPEPSCVSDMAGAKLTQKIISAWGRCHGFPQRPANGSQTEIDYE